MIGAADELKGEVPVGFVVLEAGVKTPDDQVIAELVERVRATIGAFACFRSAVVVKGLPKTRSGKILRGTMKKIADGVEYPCRLPLTILPILTDIGERLKTIGYAGAKRLSLPILRGLLASLICVVSSVSSPALGPDRRGGPATRWRAVAPGAGRRWRAV